MAYDPPVTRFVPDPELVEVAHRALLDGEDHRQRFVRQRWEEGFAAVRVALITLRELYPIERSALSPGGVGSVAVAVGHLESAHLALDDLSEEMLGEALSAVVEGLIVTPEHLAAALKETPCES